MTASPMVVALHRRLFVRISPPCQNSAKLVLRTPQALRGPRDSGAHCSVETGALEEREEKKSSYSIRQMPNFCWSCCWEIVFPECGYRIRRIEICENCFSIGIDGCRCGSGS